jgi:hypothetical protein
MNLTQVWFANPMWMDETLFIQNGTNAVVGLGHSSPLHGSVARLDSLLVKTLFKKPEYLSNFNTNYIFLEMLKISIFSFFKKRIFF